jgi:hypothetical protein
MSMVFVLKNWGFMQKKMLPSCCFLALMKFMTFLTQKQNTQNTFYSQTQKICLYDIIALQN